MIENDLINNFRYLRLSKDDFEKFIMNKKKGWRYRNDNIANFFGIDIKLLINNIW